MQPTSESSGTNYTMGLLAAVGVHVLILFGVRGAPPAFEQVEFAVEAADASVEVTLVAALPAEEPAPAVEPPPPEPEPLPPPPEPVPPPVEAPPPPEKPPAMTLPEPEPPPLPKPRLIEPPRVQKEKPKARPVPQRARPVGDGSSPIPGNDATTARAVSGGDSAKPSYLRNPHPTYPEAARAAKQEGPVQLRITYEASGVITDVRVVRSSGFPLLDERARSVVSRSRFAPMRSGGETVMVIRFTLSDL